MAIAPPLTEADRQLMPLRARQGISRRSRASWAPLGPISERCRLAPATSRAGRAARRRCLARACAARNARKGPPVSGQRAVAFEFDRVTVVRAGRRVLDEVTA